MEYAEIYREKLTKACENARVQSQELWDLLVELKENNTTSDKNLCELARVQELFNVTIKSVERGNEEVYTPDNRRTLVDATSAVKGVMDDLKLLLVKHNAG